MVSPNPKTGLAVVVPASDNRYQHGGKVKHDTLSPPRKAPLQAHKMSYARNLNGTSTPRYSNGLSASPVTDGAMLVNQPKGVPLRQPSSGVGPPHQSDESTRHHFNGVVSRPSNREINHHSKGARTNKPRLLSVDEALQYSPFSSIVPFSSDIIPTPNAKLPGSHSVFSTLEQQHTARQPLEYLNNELIKSQGQSGVAQRARHELKPLLAREAVTEFKFKPIKGVNANQTGAGAKETGSGPGQARNSRVGPFANMMLHATDLANRYPTPTSPEQNLPTLTPMYPAASSETDVKPRKSPNLPQPIQPTPIPRVFIKTQQQQSPVTPNGQIFAYNDVAYQDNAKLSAESAFIHTPSHGQTKPMVIIPVSAPKACHSDFVTYDEPSLKDEREVSRKRKRDGEFQIGVSIPQPRDQRAASDDTLHQLEGLVQDIMEAEDQLQVEGLDSSSHLKIQYFLPVHQDGREILTLAPAIHIKLESLLHKTTIAGRLEDIPVEHLRRLQDLCEGALISAKFSDVHIDAEWGTAEFASWISRLNGIENSLRAARTLLRIMVGGREEKQLYPEELLQSLLRVVKKVLDDCLIPMVEARSSASTSSISVGASSYKKEISQLLFDTKKVMTLLADLLAKVEMAEAIVTAIEFFAIPLLFVENSQSEKESVLGIQKFESLRRTAMNLISIVFSRYSAQRTFLINEVLTSLQKLPVNEKHARQYKLAEGKSVMLVSALIMQLVQTSARQSSAMIMARGSNGGNPTEDSPEGEMSDDEHHKPTTHQEDGNESDGSNDVGAPSNSTLMEKLGKSANVLVYNATKIAQYVVTFLVQRASNTAKSGESPHRQHLDMFVQDFIAVLGVPEWPAAELLLRMVFASCRNIAENPKSSAPTKTMAIELLGMMGSAISELVSTTRHASKTLDNQDSPFSKHLGDMLEEYMEGSLTNSELIVWDGPYHAVLEYQERNGSDFSTGSNAQAFYLAQWAKAASSEGLESTPERDNLAQKLQTMLSGAQLINSDTLPMLSTNQNRISYALTILSMGFCRQSDYILKILLDSITSEQITVRTRSLKSVDKILEGDPSVLDRARNVKILISNCADDGSSMVRDSALTLIGKCINLRPALEKEFLRLILKLTDDPAAGVRKRSMKMLKDIYLRNSDESVKIAIGDSLLQRNKDLDAGVSDLARQIFEDIWLSPSCNVPDLVDASAQNKVDLRNQMMLIVGTVRRSEKVASMLARLLKQLLSKNVKNAAGNFKVCKSLVASAFDLIIDSSHDTERLEQRQILLTLTVFATANAKLFTPNQLQSLQPYITNLSGKDDLEVFRSIVVIFRCVLPAQSNVQHGLLREIQKSLLQSVSKLGKAELNEVAECLWTINTALQNPELLLRLTMSVLKNLHNMRDKRLAESNQIDDLKRVKKYIQLAGSFGKHCDFEKHIQTFQSSLTWWKGQSVAGLIVESIHPFTASVQPLSIRAEAFDSIGLICQSWPYQFTQEKISDAFQDILRKGEPELQTIVLSSFRDFFARIDRQAEVKSEQSSEDANICNGEKLGGSMTANEGDGASALIAQRFLKDVLRIALASQDASALTATEVLASINRQGLVHPKESGPALVALETSSNLAIADAAFQEHRLLHQQHESMFEREYMRAIQEAFRYQRDIVRDTLGFTTRPYASKLHAMFDIIKTSKGKYQKKFLSNYCSKIDFDVSKMDLSGTPPIVLQFSRFLIENLIFFEYGRLDELLHTIACMERIVADTGSGIAHSISTEIFNITVTSMPAITVPGVPQDQGEAARPAMDLPRLRQLTTACIILSSLWDSRTYLRRLYGLSASQQRRDNKTKAAAKDLSKAPSRNQGVSGEKIVASIADKANSLNSEETMIQQCKDFVELLSVDNEVKVAAEGEEDVERPETPVLDDEQDTPMSGGSRGVKRKGSLSTMGTPMKKRKSRPSLKRRKSGKSAGSEEEWD